MPEATCLSENSTQKKKKTRKNLRSIINQAPFQYLTESERRERLALVIKHYSDLIPRLHLAIMFSRTEQTITVRIADTHPARDAAIGRRLFAKWLKNQPAFDAMPLLISTEVRYLRNLRSVINDAYYGERQKDPSVYAAKLKEELDLSATADRSSERAVCSNEACVNSFPPKPKYFPNLARGSTTPGRCAVCVYLTTANYARRVRAGAETGPRGKQLNAEEKARFWEIEAELREKLPTRVLSALFAVSPTTINILRQQPFERTDGKAVFHGFQTRPSRPRFPFLTTEENQSVGDEWEIIRQESTEKEFGSQEDRRAEFLEHTTMQLRMIDSAKTRVCRSCHNTFILDELCFPYGRDKKTREKVLRHDCRACYSELWD